jgi:hypothetical protein
MTRSLALWAIVTSLAACSSDEGTDTDTLAGLSCDDGAGPVWSGADASWVCGSAQSDHHNHDGAYAALTHEHDASAIISGVLDEARIPDSVARTADVLGIVLEGDGPGSGLDADTLDGIDGSEVASFRRVVIVSPGATAVDSGVALLDALAAIVDASDSNPYLLMLEPGVYDLGAATLAMKSWVSVVGSGPRVTRLTSSVGSFGGGTVNVASDSRLSQLTVDNTSNSTYGVGIYASASAPAEITDVTVRLTASANNAFGISQGGGALAIERCAIEVNGNFAHGIASQNGTATIRDSTVNVTGTAGISWALWTNGGIGAANIQVFNSVLKAPGGIRVGSSVDPAVVAVHHSVIDATGSMVLLAHASTTLRVAGSQLTGTVTNTGGGTYACFGSYTATMASACP